MTLKLKQGQQSFVKKMFSQFQSQSQTTTTNHYGHIIQTGDTAEWSLALRNIFTLVYM